MSTHSLSLVSKVTQVSRKFACQIQTEHWDNDSNKRHLESSLNLVKVARKGRLFVLGGGKFNRNEKPHLFSHPSPSYK